MDAFRLMPQAAVVEVLAEFGRRWNNASDPFRHEAQALDRPFPFVMTRLSLDALLQSLTMEALWELIDAEEVRDVLGPPRIGHIIAGNTPLLAWTSLLRALLMRSGSRVKLPSGEAALWGYLFQRSLASVSPTLASSITLEQWPGGTGPQEQELLQSVDLALVYGSDETITALRALCPLETALIGYGHRVSLGWVLPGADGAEAADGLATDVLLYDQGGCLSPQTVFVSGTMADAVAFAAVLAGALTDAVRRYPLPSRLPQAAARVREARALARMEPDTHLWEDPALRWTVVARPEGEFTASPTHGVVSVQPLPAADALPAALRPVQGRLQGAAVAGERGRLDAEAALRACGASYLCAPGRLQAPPLSWPQDNIAPLRSLCL